ncbi:HupE/UreJ family protein [Maritimibacter dapengensis]|nr:HupE/UreJ family protein [Maritimibacter dapengensis]
MSPAIVDAEVGPDRLRLTMIVQGEAMVAGVDLAAITDTNNSPLADAYDRLRALSPTEFEERFRNAWPKLSQGLDLQAGETALDPALTSVSTAGAMADDLPRQTQIVVSAALPDDGTDVTVGWASRFGPMILRQSVDGLAEGQDPYSAFLGPGQVSEPMPRDGTAVVGGLRSFGNYIWLGFTHILPKGLDHILFVLGLFFFSRHLKPLFFQVTSFTVAHTLTLALATLGIVSVPSAVVEPLIAASIAFVAIENILRPQLSRLRIAVVFAFGLLHGLGFASVLGEIGLSPAHFIASLIAFNIGVELGQLTVILLGFLTVSIWFGNKPWYRTRVVIPASAMIGLMGAWWAVERVIL